MKTDKDIKILRQPIHTTQINRIPIRRTFTPGKSINLCWYAADCVVFDVRWLGITTDEWLELELALGWRQAIRQVIGDRDMVKWLAERERSGEPHGNNH